MRPRLSLAGSLAVPEGARGATILLVGAPEHRRDPLRLALADALHHAGFATLIASLATEEDPAPGVERLAGRVASAVAFVAAEPRLRHLPLGVFADGGAVAAAVVALAHDPERVHAFVACGGRPDEAPLALARVRAPALLVAGAIDEATVTSGRAAVRALPANAELAIVDDTVDPLADRDAIGTVAWLVRRWFLAHLVTPVS